MTIELKQLRFFAYHGLFPEERMTGTHFEVNLSVSYSTGEKTLRDIDSTINYVSLFEIVRERMDVPTDLLETIAMEIAEIIKGKFSQTSRVSISIAKLHPPIAKFTGQVGVNFEKQY